MITSKTNATIKYISNLKLKKYRSRENKFLVEGIKMVREIINSEGIAPEFIIYSKEILEATNIGKTFLKEINTESFLEVSRQVFEYLSDTDSPQGIMAVLDIKQNEINYLEKKIIKNKDKYILLDRLQDPGNVGTIIRTALSFGINNIIIIEGTADVFSPKIVRSTMGGIYKAEIYTIKENELNRFINIIKASEYILIGTSLKAKKNIHEEKYTGKEIFVIGNEANGISIELETACNKLVKIPMEETIESLNASVAASICMYEMYKNMTGG